MLTAIAERDEDLQLAFKGGTSLRLCHFSDYRCSADLDFSLTDGIDAEAATHLITAALMDCRERIGLPLLELDERNPPRIEYVGPLGAKPRFVKLDLAPDEFVEDTTVLPIRRRYEDQEDGRCRVYTLEEITGEKLRCVMQRLQCHDLYDLYELLVVSGVDAEATWPLFQRKARHRDREPGRFGESFDDRVAR